MESQHKNLGGGGGRSASEGIEQEKLFSCWASAGFMDPLDFNGRNKENRQGKGSKGVKGYLEVI